MSETNAVNKKVKQTIVSHNEGTDTVLANNASLITAPVPPPLALPKFVTSSESERTSPVFHSPAFRPEIPENTNDNLIPVEERDNDSLGAVGSSLLGWVRETVGVRGSNLLNKVAEKAKSSVDTVLTTLDPQMKDFMDNASDLGVIVASDKEIEVGSVREAFQNVFSRSSVRGFEVEDLDIPRQVVGLDAAAKIAFLKVEAIQRQLSLNYPIVAIQNFIAEISPEKWYDLDLIILHGKENTLMLETYSQMIPLAKSIVDIAKEGTPEDYKFRELGYSVAVAQIMGTNLQVLPSEWQETLTGITRRERIFSAAKVIANLYKNTLL